ncbi:MAG: AAA family ATPase [Candidatus Dormibacteria bacterium]
MAELTPNPYHFGSRVKDAVNFTDRRHELATLTSHMLNHQNVIVIAPRRFGKTSLLYRAMAAVEDRGGRTGRVSLMKCSTTQEVAEALMRGVVKGPMGWLRGQATEIARRVRSMRITPQFTFEPATGAVSVKLDSPHSAVDWRPVIEDVIHLLNDLNERGHPVSLVIDEFQKAKEIEPDLPDVFKDLVDDVPDVSLVFAGSKRHLMDQLVNDRDHGALYNVGTKLYLQRISEPDFSSYLRARAGAGGASMSQDTARRIYDAAAGIPNDVQLIAFRAYQEATHHPGNNEITAADVEEAVRAAAADQSDDFQNTFDQLAQSQQLLLKLIACEEVTEINGKRTIARLGVTNHAAGNAARALQRRELISREGAVWTVSSGLLREWLRDDDQPV